MSKQGAQKKSRNVEVITALRAFEATYKAACRHHNVVPYKPLLKGLQQCQESSVPCNKVLLAGASVDGAVMSAVAECLASYAAVKGLSCWGCSVGDEGLNAIACLLRASTSRWWKGCKLSSLEVLADGRSLPPTLGAAASPSSGAAPEAATPPPAAAVSLPLPTTAATSTATTGFTAAEGTPAAPVTGTAAIGQLPTSSQQQSVAAQVGAASPSSIAGGGSCSNPMPGTLAPAPTPPCTTLRPVTAISPQKQQMQLRLPPGVCPPVPDHLQLNFPNHMQLAQQALSDRFCSPDHIHYKYQPPRPLLEVKKWVLASTMDAWKQQHGQAGEKAVISNTQQQLAQQQQQQQQQQAPPARAKLEDEKCPRFSTAALQDLSLALGVAGLSLMRLVLDHTLLGDAGTATLAAGLGKCSSLKQLSLCYCNIGSAGIKELAAALTLANSSDNSSSNAANGSSANVRSSSNGAAATTVVASAGVSRLGMCCSTGSNGPSGGGKSSCPELQELLLNGNPLTGFGLQQLNTALRAMTSLKVLGLAEIGVTEADKVQLQGLVYALTVGPSSLAQLDFDANYIGDRIASHFLTLLPAKPSLVLLKLTGRVGPEVVTQLAALTEQNLKAARPAKRKAKKT